MDIFHIFYTSKAWRDLTYILKIERGGKCQRCGHRPRKFSNLIGHHTVELNEENIHNPQIALNPELIEIICSDCHNKEHRRFGNKHNVYIIYGSPLAGKKTLANTLMQYGDIAVDMDALWQAITLSSRDKPKNVRFNVFKLRDDLIDQIKTRYGQWYDAYLIGGYPDKYERERLAQTLGAELIYCESTKEECIERVEKNNMPAAYQEYINEWWDRYTPR